MPTADFETLLRRTLDDRRLSRGERQAVAEVFAESRPSAAEIGRYRQLAFAQAREAVASDLSPQDALNWLEEVVQVLSPVVPAACDAATPEACFSPGDDCRHRIVGLLNAARGTVDICVFTVTDNLITEAIVAAHRRGVVVRVVTDDTKALDIGSDIEVLAGAGIEVRFDRSKFHMHHKFAIFDRTVLVTGSYNWTLGAARDNEEHIVVLGDPPLLARFQQEFDRLWKSYG